MVDSKGIHIQGVIGEDYTFNDFMSDIKMSNLPLRKNINIYIDSIGGYCQEADAIYDKLLSLKKQGYVINTFNDGNVMSCATIIFAAGDNRKFDFGKGNLLIHNPYCELQGDAATLRKISKQLQQEEDRYTLIYTKLGKNDMADISSTMDENRCLTPEEVKKFKIATVTKNDNLFNPDQMLDNKQYAFAALAKPVDDSVKLDINQKNVKVMKIVDFVKTLVKDLVIKNLVVTSADGVDYTVTNEDGSEDLKVGSAVTVDGQPYEGEIILADDTVITVENGIVTKIEKPEEEVPAEEAKTEEPKSEETPSEETPAEEPKENTDAIDSLRGKVDELFALLNDLTERVNALEGDTSKEESAKAEIENIKAQIRNMASSGRVNPVNQANQQPEQKKSFFGFEK